jgi:hypothetical protein
VARPGTPVLVMHPAGGPPRPGWADGLPQSLGECFGSVPYDDVRSWIEQPLTSEDIDDYQLWWFDVPEWFTSAEHLYRRLTGHRSDPLPIGAALPALRSVLACHGGAQGVPLRHHRLVALFRWPLPQGAVAAATSDLVD